VFNVGGNAYLVWAKSAAHLFGWAAPPHTGIRTIPKQASTSGEVFVRRLHTDARLRFMVVDVWVRKPVRFWSHFGIHSYGGNSS
jgi:hypothetical protein